MTWSGLIKEVLTKCIEQCKRTVQMNIRDNLFGQKPHGARLAEYTKRKKGNDKALVDEGLFRNGMKIKVSGSEGVLYSDGRPEEIQRYFLFGTKKMPARNAFKKDQPSIGKRFVPRVAGGVTSGLAFKQTGNTNELEGHVVSIAAAMIYNHANKQIKAVTSKFK